MENVYDENFEDGQNYEEDYDQESWDGVSEPVPSQFDDYDDYVSALVDHGIKKATSSFQQPTRIAADAVAQGVREAQQPPVNPDIPDDPLREKRREIVEQIRDHTKKMLLYERDTLSPKAKQNAELHRYHAQKLEKELEALDPSPEYEWEQKQIEETLEGGMSNLMNPELVDHPVWKTDRMRHDAPIVVVDAIRRAKTTIRLPAESSPHGNITACEPRNMMSIQLSQDQMATFKKMVFSSGGASDPDSVFRRSWSALHSLGYVHAAVPLIASEGESVESESDPEKMTFSQFCEWREGSEKKKHGFVFPTLR